MIGRPRKAFGRALALLSALVLLTGGGAYYLLVAPYAGFKDPAFIELQRGTPTRTLASQLREAGVIRNEWQFLAIRAIRRNARLQAGEYRFDKPDSAWSVFDRIVRGDVFYYEVSVPEGHNIFEVAEAIAGLGTMTAAEFLKAARDPAPIRDLDPQATSLEGYLFPSTYRLTRHTTAAQACKLMTDQFRKNWAHLAGKSKADVHEIVTLASLVEKETGVPEERPTVASVYRNRLNAGMRLQCDPTTIYAALLENRYRGTIYKSDLESDHPYNTYRHPGLPPGPIANPGVRSLEAALNPAETDYLFFVAKADGSGGHHFSRDLASHNSAVQALRHAGR
jgi:UPF0755 protein